MNSDAALAMTIMMAAIGLLVGLGVGIVFLLTLQRAVERCAPQNRELSPGQVWLILIPLFNFVWQFILVSRIAKTLSREFASRGTPPAPVPDDYGRSFGTAWCVLNVVSFIPFVGILTGLAGFMCWIIYWVEISRYSRALAEGGAVAAWSGAAPAPVYVPMREAAGAGAQCLVALVLVFGYGANYLQCQALPVMAPLLRADLGFSNSQYAQIVTAFLIGMMAGYVLMTVLTVLCGARWGLVAAFAGASLAACASVAFPSYGGLLATRFLLGFFTGGLLPAAVQSARDWFPPRVRPLLIGTVLAAGPALWLLAPPLLVFGSLHFGWRPVLIVTGLPTLVAAVLCLAAWPKSPAREPFGVSTAAVASSGMVALGLLFAAPIYGFAISWLPMYLQRDRAINVQTLGILGIAMPAAAIGGALLAGVLACALTDSATRAWRVRAVLLTVFGCLLPIMALTGSANNWVIAIGLGSLSVMAYMGWSVLLYSAVADALPARAVAAAAAIGALMGALGGVASSAALGRLLEAHGFATLLVVMGATAAVGVVGVLLLAWLCAPEVPEVSVRPASAA
jgi:ACS family hexuronate transporter-like MFS transporter